VQLLASKTVSREPGEYQVDTATVLALRPFADVEQHPHPGQRVPFRIRHSKAAKAAERVCVYHQVSPAADVDVRAYQAMRLDAALELLVPFGYDAARLRGALR